MSLTYKGRKFSASAFADDLMSAAVGSVKEQLREMVSAVRLPSTGEFPTVTVHGETLDDLRLSVEGSPELLALVKDKLGTENWSAISSN